MAKQAGVTRSENHTHAAEEALTDGILSRCPIRRPQFRDAARRRDASEGWPVLAVAIADEIARPLMVRGGLAQLLGDPGVGRVPRLANMHDPARPERDHEEGVERSVEQIRHWQEVAGPDLRGVVVEERRPGLPSAARRARGSHVPLDRGLGDADIELQQLAPDALGTPQPIGGVHRADQRDRLGRHLRPRCGPGPRLPSPE